MIRRKSIAGGVVIATIVLAAAWLRPFGEPAAHTSGPTTEAQGILLSVDSDAGVLTIQGSEGTQEFYVTPDTVIELGRTERIAFRDLTNFIGTTSVVLSADTDAQQDANRITLVMPFRNTLPAGEGEHTP